MSIDIDAACSFLAGHGRVLDRRRLDVLINGGVGDRRALLAAVDAYRNPDGGYGWGLEPDCRAAESQPAGALHALEVFVEAAPTPTRQAGELLDWLAAVSLPDGSLSFALPMRDPTACAPFWAQADPREPSLQITAAVAAQAHRLARHDQAVRDHPWLAGATAFCLDRIRALTGAPVAYELSFALGLLDAAADTHPEALDLLDGVSRYVPSDGRLAVAGGAEGETLHLLDLAPRPGRPVRELFATDAVERDLDRVEAGQAEDGGWRVDFASFSPAAALEWRGYATVGTIALLRANGRAG